ncbi:MAG: RNA-directed DNA polymerase [Rikenellaceae bacterium]
MVNAKHDTTSYENGSYQREIFDGNALYDAYNRAKRGSDWKPQVQKYEMTYLLNLSKVQRELEEKTYKFLPNSEFVIKERGKTRVICGEQIQDRIVKHSLCDEILNPEMKKYFIYDNGASLEGKGIDFSRRRLLTHLNKYYMNHKSNDGYILLIDFSKYYDNIQHDVLMDLFRTYISNDHALWLLENTIDRSKVDVSYMTDEEYSRCMSSLFNSLEHDSIDKQFLTGEKFMYKHLNIGDQVAQVAGIAYPIKIDNYIKIVKSVKYYGRYMDDSYIIHESKEYLEQLLKDIIELANSIGITVNLKKTHICKLSEQWKFLQMRYSLTDTGRIIKKINPQRITAMRRKMKKVIHVLSINEYEDWFRSWFKNYYKYMSKQQRLNITNLFERLKEEKLCMQSL